MNQIGAFKQRRAVGSIIAGAFIVLILISSYEFYLLNNQLNKSYQESYQEMKEYDISKSQEQLQIIDYEETLNDNILEIEIGVMNEGPELVNISYAAVFHYVHEDKSSYPLYYSDGTIYSRVPLRDTDISILKPQKYSKIEIKVNKNLDKYNGDEYIVYLVTNRGNQFTMRERDLEIVTNIYDIINRELADVLGNVLPKYDSFRWLNRISSDDNYIINGFTYTWFLKDGSGLKPQQYPLIGVDVYYFGTKDLYLDGRTVLLFDSLINDQNDFQIYLIYSTEYEMDSDEPFTISEYPTFNPEDPGFINTENILKIEKHIIDSTPRKYHLYFAPTEINGDPLTGNRLVDYKSSVDSFKITLGIYGYHYDQTGYGQSFPLIAVGVSPYE
jgi:hypothetical protein